MDPIEYTMNYPETLLGGPQDAVVRTAVSISGVLEIARLLEMQACDKDQTSGDAGLLMYCTEVLRQHAEAMTERQPPPNK